MKWEDGLENSNSGRIRPGQNEFKDHDLVFYTLLHTHIPDWT